MVNGVVGGAVVEVDRRESESKGCDVFYPSTLFIPSVWLPQVSTRTCCGASIEVATVLPPPRPSESKSYAYKAVSLSMIIISAEWP
jgi:hypothetical protein